MTALSGIIAFIIASGLMALAVLVTNSQVQEVLAR